MTREEKHQKLVEILSVPIYRKIGVDPAIVVADYLMDHGVEYVGGEKDEDQD